MPKAHGRMAGVLTALALWRTPAVGAEVAVSRDVEIHGCRVFSRAYWSHTRPHAPRRGASQGGR